MEPGDFRPISLTATICKVLEKILATHIIRITTVLQRLSVPVKSNPEFMINALQKVFGDMNDLSGEGHGFRVRLFDAIDLIFEKTFVILEVSSKPPFLKIPLLLL